MGKHNESDARAWVAGQLAAAHPYQLFNPAAGHTMQAADQKHELAAERMLGNW
jgi:hypothetical protein